MKTLPSTARRAQRHSVLMEITAAGLGSALRGARLHSARFDTAPGPGASSPVKNITTTCNIINCSQKTWTAVVASAFALASLVQLLILDIRTAAFHPWPAAYPLGASTEPPLLSSFTFYLSPIRTPPKPLISQARIAWSIAQLLFIRKSTMEHLGFSST